MKSSKWIALLLFFIMLLSPGAVWAEEETPTPSPPVDEYVPPVYYPNITMGTQSRTPTFQAGKDSRLLVPLYNSGQGEARDVVVTLQVEDPEKFPFVLEGLNYRKGVSTIGGRRRAEALFMLSTRKNIPEGIYTIPFQVEYANDDLKQRYQYSGSLFVKIENEFASTKLIVEELQIDNHRLSVGSNQVVRVAVRNEGDHVLQDIDLTLSGFGINGIFMETTYHTRSLKSLEPGESGVVPFPLRVENGAEEGTYPLQLEMVYKDSYGTAYESAETIYIPVSSTSFAAGLLAIENLRVPSGSVSPYSDFNVSLRVRNTSSEKVENILVKADGGDTLLPKTPALQQISTLAPDESREINFTFFAKDGIEAKNYPLEIRVEPAQGGSSNDVVVQYTGVLVGNTGASSGTPKIIIDQYRIPTDYVEAGSSFPLTLSFFNTHTGEGVRNIRISLTSEGDVFSPVGSSNTFFIQRIAPGSRVEREITLRPRPDAGYKIHNVYADIEYEDNDGNPHQTRELIGVPVIQEARLVFGEVETGMESFVGNPLPISLEFYNAGRGKIRNLVVSIEGDFDTADGALYIGNMEGGASNYYDATIMPRSPGDMSGKVIFQFDDEIDQHHVVEKTFDMNVMEMMGPPDDFFYEEPMMEQSGRGVLPWIIGGVMAAALAGGIWYRRRRKKKLEEVEDDE